MCAAVALLGATPRAAAVRSACLAAWTVDDGVPGCIGRVGRSVLAGAAGGDPSVLQLFLDSVRTGWARLLTALALPVRSEPATKLIGVAMRLRINKTWIVLGVALVVGGGAAFMANSYLRAQVEEIESRGKGENVKLVVAKKDMPKGATLGPESLAVRNVPREWAHSNAVTPNSSTALIAAPLPIRPSAANHCCGRS